jgi:hypothetical protein
MLRNLAVRSPPLQNHFALQAAIPHCDLPPEPEQENELVLVSISSSFSASPGSSGVKGNKAEHGLKSSSLTGHAIP